jgi:hypothetical protein
VIEEEPLQTANSITDVQFNADPIEPGIVALTVTFRISSNGPSHVAGLVATHDNWVTSQVVAASFQGFGTGFENWRASYSVPGPPVGFEFVVFCDDFGGVDSVPRIWNTNGGHRFQARA